MSDIVPGIVVFVLFSLAVGLFCMTLALMFVANVEWACLSFMTLMLICSLAYTIIIKRDWKGEDEGYNGSWKKKG